MAYKAHKTKRSARKTPSKRRRLDVSLKPLQLNPRLRAIPQKRMVTLRYHETLDVNLSGSGAGNWVFRANSIYDPNQTGVGHQPMFHDQLEALYNRYTVVGSKITITSPWQNWDGELELVTWTDDNGVANLTDVDNAVERMGASVDLCHTNQRTISTTSFFSAKKFFSAKNPLDDPDMGAAFGANPLRGAWFIVAYNGNVNGASGVFTMKATIEYTCILTEPKTPIGS